MKQDKKVVKAMTFTEAKNMLADDKFINSIGESCETLANVRDIYKSRVEQLPNMFRALLKSDKSDVNQNGRALIVKVFKHWETVKTDNAKLKNAKHDRAKAIIKSLRQSLNNATSVANAKNGNWNKDFQCTVTTNGNNGIPHLVSRKHKIENVHDKKALTKIPQNDTEINQWLIDNWNVLLVCVSKEVSTNIHKEQAQQDQPLKVSNG